MQTPTLDLVHQLQDRVRGKNDREIAKRRGHRVRLLDAERVVRFLRLVNERPPSAAKRTNTAIVRGIHRGRSNEM